MLQSSDLNERLLEGRVVCIVEDAFVESANQGNDAVGTQKRVELPMEQLCGRIVGVCGQHIRWQFPAFVPAREWLANEGFDPVYGARPLRRAIQRSVEKPLSKRILAGELSEGDEVLIDASEDGLAFKKIGEAVAV